MFAKIFVYFCGSGEFFFFFFVGRQLEMSPYTADLKLLSVLYTRFSQYAVAIVSEDLQQSVCLAGFFILEGL